jgi:hypothetical protein
MSDLVADRIDDDVGRLAAVAITALNGSFQGNVCH